MTNHAPAASGESLSGALRDWPAAELLGFIGASGRTGALRLVVRYEAHFALLYFRAGELVLVTSSSEPTRFDDALRLRHPEAFTRAEDEQRTSAKPARVTLAESGVVARSTLVESLHHSSREQLARLLEAHDLLFSWRDLAALPTWVDAYGKYVPLTRNTLFYAHPKRSCAADSSVPPPPSLLDLTLDRVRAESFASRHAWPTADRVLTRCCGFSESVRRLALGSSERRMLGFVNDRTTLREIATRVALAEDDARRIAHILTELGLLNAPDGHARGTSISTIDAR